MRDAIGIHQSETKAVAGGAMLGGVLMQVNPQARRERVFGIPFAFAATGEWRFNCFAAVLRMQHGFEARAGFRQLQIAPREVRRFAKTDDKNALSMLRHGIQTIAHLASAKSCARPNAFFFDTPAILNGGHRNPASNTS